MITKSDFTRKPVVGSFKQGYVLVPEVLPDISMPKPALILSNRRQILPARCELFLGKKKEP